MTKGDVIANNVSVSDAAYLDIQPGAGIEWVIHNIYHEDQCELYVYDGTNEIKIDNNTTNVPWCTYFWHCNNTNRIRVKNINGSSQRIAYDGIITKE